MSKGVIANAFTFLSRELKKAKLCNDTRPLDTALNEMNLRKDKPGFWGYNLQRLIFNNIPAPRGSMPTNVKSLQIVLSVEIHEKALTKEECLNPIVVDKKRGIDKKYNFSIEISGYSEENKVLSHWHLDFDSDDKNEYIHPDFHLTFGGNAMKKEGGDANKDFGRVLLVPSPRLPHPPMDAILGVDFVIKNFVKSDITKVIIENSQYRKAVKESQERLWRPYMMSIAKHWCGLSCQKFTTNDELSKKYIPYLES